MSDVKALIARLRKYLQAREEVTPQIAGQVFDTVVDLDMGSRGHIRLLASDIAQVADALEAAQQAPKNLSTESWGVGTVLGSAQPSGAANAHLRDPQALLSRFAPAQQAPAVDREALARYFYMDNAGWEESAVEHWKYLIDRIHAGKEAGHDKWLCFQAADRLIASGILQDAAVVRSEGYDEGWKDACEEFYPEGAQQAPAVDREAFREVMFQRGVLTRAQSDRAVDALVASGILLDAAEVEARGLEKAAEKVETHWAPDVPEAVEIVEGTAALLRETAQQVREGN